jgi:hypothetical protein
VVIQAQTPAEAQRKRAACTVCAGHRGDLRGTETPCRCAGVADWEEEGEEMKSQPSSSWAGGHQAEPAARASRRPVSRLMHLADACLSHGSLNGPMESRLRLMRRQGHYQVEQEVKDRNRGIAVYRSKHIIANPSSFWGGSTGL